MNDITIDHTRQLCVKALLNAVEDYSRAHRSTESAQVTEERRLAHWWLFEDTQEDLVSMTTCCDVLELDVGYVRRRVVEDPEGCRRELRKLIRKPITRPSGMKYRKRTGPKFCEMCGRELQFNRGRLCNPCRYKLSKQRTGK
jgi:hypothetical protein